MGLDGKEGWGNNVVVKVYLTPVVQMVVVLGLVVEGRGDEIVIMGWDKVVVCWCWSFIEIGLVMGIGRR